ncbi:MAG: TonB-dependent receptor [Flavobacteriales bacterium]
MKSCILFLASFFLCSQSDAASISGNISAQGVKINRAYVLIKENSLSVFSGSSGHYSFTSLPAGEYTVEVSHSGFITQSKKVKLSENADHTLNFVLHPEEKKVNEIVITTKSKAQEVRESSFSVNVVETKKFANTTTDLNQVLNKTTGIRVRESGGLGSDFNFSLNGFSGNQVKFFLDGIPMDNFGSSLTLNNIPPNLVSRIEVYKGVVPVWLGSDALGGAINLVTNSDVKNYVDASYSIGSFNTHRAMLLTRMASKSGWVLSANAFYNYSDNNYFVDAQIPDPVSGKVSGFTRVQRFHDAYESTTAQIEVGIRNKKIADHLLLGFIFSTNHKDVQQGANMTKVAGQIFSTEKVFIPTLKYKKDNLFTKGTSLNFYASYNFRDAMAVDTSSRIYDWFGNYTVKQVDATSGELTWDKTLFTFRDEVALAAFNFSYQINTVHSLAFNNTFSRFSRVGEDPISYTPVPYGSPNVLTKNITGLSYKVDLFKKRWSTIFFSKAFFMDAALYKNDWDTDSIIPVNNHFLYPGFGAASSVHITKWLQAKLSYENTYRLPEGNEMFGDGLLLQESPDLQPEKSSNFNVGFLVLAVKKKHKLNAEANYLYRTPQNLIRLTTIGVISQYQNLRSAMINGVEGGVQYNYNNHFTCELNATYQDIINTNKYEGNTLSYLYLDRLPNIPFFFANAALGGQMDNVIFKKSKLSIDYTCQFVEAFYLKWPSQGSASQKYDIPRQITHDATISYSLQNGRYNFSFSCFNIADAKRYDNFLLQKPGRSFSLKFRYFLSTDHKK